MSGALALVLGEQFPLRSLLHGGGVKIWHGDGDSSENNGDDTVGQQPWFLVVPEVRPGTLFA